MASLLESLPVELIESIVKFLNRQDIGSLRHASRLMEKKASHGSFAKRFRRKNIRLERETLNKLAQLSSEINATSLIQHCTVTGIVGLREGPTLERPIDEYTRLLTAIFRNMKTSIKSGSITWLILRVVLRLTRRYGHKGEDKRVTARDTLEVTMTALHRSGLSVHGHLDLFGNVPSCGLEYSAFLRLAQRPGPATIFQYLRELTLTVSSSIISTMPLSYSRHLIPENSSHQGEHLVLTLDAISHLSAIMPKLERLDFCWFNIDRRMSTLRVPRPVHEITSSSPPLALIELTLRGVDISAATLCQFIRATNPWAIRLKDVNLVAGTYASVFKYITHPATSPQCYQFEELRQRLNMVHFSAPDEPEDLSEIDALFRPTRISQIVDDVGQEGIVHHLMPILLPAHTPRAHVCLPAFGPPISQSFPFVPRNGRHIDVKIGLR